jgi:fibronectin-binding autotransporter adhesin
MFDRAEYVREPGGRKNTFPHLPGRPTRRGSRGGRAAMLLATAAAVETFGNLLTPCVQATTTTYTLNGGDPSQASSFTTPMQGSFAGWSSGAAPTAGTGGNTNVYDVAGAYRLRTPQDAVNYTFAGDGLKIDSADVLFMKTTGGTITVNNLELNGGAVDLSNTGGPTGFTSTLAGNITLDPSTIPFFGSEQGQTLVVSAAISGSGGVQVNGNTTAYGGNTIAATSTVVFSGANTYLGPTTINAGTLTIGGAGTLGSGSYAGTISIAASTTLGYSSSATQILSGTISGTGSLVVSGTGALTLTATNSYSGGTTISSGTLQLGNGTAAANLMNGNYAISSGARLYIDEGTYTDPSGGNVTGAGTVEINAVSYAGTANTVNPQLTNNFTGTLAVDAGRLDSNTGGFGGSTTIAINSGGAMIYRGGTFALNLALAGTGGDGLGALRVKDVSNSMAALFTGNVSLTSSALIDSINSGGSDLSANVTFSGVISGASANTLTISNTSATTFQYVLSGNNTYAGATVIPSGTVVIGGTGDLGDLGGTQGGSYAGGITLTNSPSTVLSATAGPSVLQYSSSVNQTFSGSISGAGSLIDSGTGPLALTASNTYQGGTTISAGTLRANNGANNGSATGSGNVIVAAGAAAYGGGRLGGSGSVSGTVSLATSGTAKQGGMIAAGPDDSTTGTLTTGNETWAGGAAYQWKITALGNVAAKGSGNSSNGITVLPGTSTTWDDVSMTGLSIGSGGSNQPFTIALHNTAPLSAGTTYSWVIGQITSSKVTGLFTGFENTNLLTETPTGTTANSGANTNAIFALDTSGFGGGFSVTGASPSASFDLEFISSGSGDNLVLSYDATPEPGTGLLMLAGALPTLSRRRRHVRQEAN